MRDRTNTHTHTKRPFIANKNPGHALDIIYECFYFIFLANQSEIRSFIHFLIHIQALPHYVETHGPLIDQENRFVFRFSFRLILFASAFPFFHYLSLYLSLSLSFSRLYIHLHKHPHIIIIFIKNNT